MTCVLQVQYSQRNLPGNSQRKFLQSTYIPKGYSGDYELDPSFPLELKDVQLLSVSPSGMLMTFGLTAADTKHGASYLQLPANKFTGSVLLIIVLT